jgi:hypothetical protein
LIGVGGRAFDRADVLEPEQRKCGRYHQAPTTMDASRGWRLYALVGPLDLPPTVASVIA